MDSPDCQLLRLPLPGDPAIMDAVTALWAAAFGEKEVRDTRDQFAGAERGVNEDTLYVLLHEGKVASCCHLTRKAGTGLAGLGGVVTDPAFRGRGFSRKVCTFALQDFDASGGEVVWLGTGNPAAANLYHELGFAFLPGTAVMRRLRKGLTDTQFLNAFFQGRTGTVTPGSAACRIPMIPLLTSRLGFTVTDRVAGFCGAEKVVEISCMSLYPAYEAVRAAGGDWACLDTGDGRIGALGSWKPQDDGTALVDGCWHANHRAAAPNLFRTLIAQAQGAGHAVRMQISEADDAKAALAAELGAVPGAAVSWQPRQGILIPMREYLLTI